MKKRDIWEYEKLAVVRETSNLDKSKGMEIEKKVETAVSISSVLM